MSFLAVISLPTCQSLAWSIRHLTYQVHGNTQIAVITSCTGHAAGIDDITAYPTSMDVPTEKGGTGTAGTVLHDAALAAASAVDLMVKLLDLHPLSQRPQPGALGQHPSQAQDDNSEQQGTAGDTSTQAQDESQPEIWPKPEPREWQAIELVATRACGALDWALSPTVVHHVPMASWNALALRLPKLLERLLIGHLPDLDLDMHPLFQAALKPVLRVRLAGFREYTALAVAMLSTRMAVDFRLLDGNTTAEELLQLVMSTFCESQLLSPHHPSCSRCNFGCLSGTCS